MRDDTVVSTEESVTGISRRTVMRGAAWSIPVVALVTSVPTAAASGDIVVVPGNSVNFVGACSEARNVTFTVTDATDSSPLSGTQVSVALPTGWSWADTTTTPKVFVSDANGIVTVTGAIAGSTTGAASIVGTVLPSGPSASVPVSVTGTIARELHTVGVGPLTSPLEMGGIPQGSTAIAWNVFLSADGTLYTWHQDSGYAVVDTGVVDVAAHHFSQVPPLATQEIDIVTYLTSAGVGKTWTSGGGGALTGTVVRTGVPAGAEVVGWNSFLDPNGDLWVGGAVRAIGVTSAVVQHEVDSAAATQDFATFVTATGVHTARLSGTGVWAGTGTYTAPTADATAIGWSVSLRPNGDLYYQGTLIAQNVVSTQAQHTTSNAGESDLITYVLADGTGVSRAYGANTGTTTWSQNFGANATVVGNNGFLTADGRLYDGAELLDTDVLTADSWHERESASPYAERDWFAWTRGAAC